MRTIVMATALLLVAGSTAWAADGAAEFKKSCAKCHGETGMSDTSSGKSMKVPPLVGDEKVAAQSIEELAAAIKETKKHPKAVKSLGDAELKATAEYAKSLAAKK